jgi:hypothetical protein
LRVLLYAQVVNLVVQLPIRFDSNLENIISFTAPLMLRIFSSSSTHQICCVDARCALPCTGIDGDVPCVFTPLPCCICCYNYQCKIACCDTLGNLKAKIQDGGAPEMVVCDAEKVASSPMTVEMGDRQ